MVLDSASIPIDSQRAPTGVPELSALSQDGVPSEATPLCSSVASVRSRADVTSWDRLRSGICSSIRPSPHHAAFDVTKR
ncbi:unnamed protein product [Knipowitschia caucasica]